MEQNGIIGTGLITQIPNNRKYPGEQTEQLLYEEIVKQLVTIIAWQTVKAIGLLKDAAKLFIVVSDNVEIKFVMPMFKLGVYPGLQTAHAP